MDWLGLAGRTEKAPKKTVALVIGYNGGAYKGLQLMYDQRKSPDDPEAFLPTVESELELALLRAGAIIPANFGNLRKLHWTRVGRTDSGVSAACNVVTGRLIVGKGSEEDIRDLVSRVNQFLPADIRLHGAAVVTRNFNARYDGSARSYVYVMPSYCVCRSTPSAVRAAVAGMGCEDARGMSPVDACALESAAGLRELRIQEDELCLFRKALASFQGTKYFANFTGANIDRKAPQAWRHVRECSCGEPFLDADGREWLPISVSADSFLTYQIRKMVATAAQVSQGYLPLDFLPAALDRSIMVKTPKFPPLGLIFLRPFFRHPDRGHGDAEGDGLDALVERHCTAEYRDGLQRAIIDANSKGCTWVRWLACTLQFEDHMRGQSLRAVAEYEVNSRSKSSRVQERQAAAVQVAAILGGAGEPLWVGRHKWIGRA